MSLKRSLALLGASLILVALLAACTQRVPLGTPTTAPTIAPTTAPAASLPEPKATASPAPPKAEWTVLVYLHADHNLEVFALEDLKEMASVGSTDKVNVVVQVDRRADKRVNQGVLNLPDWTTSKRLYVEKGRFKELADLGEPNSDDPQVLKDFIVWGKRSYPANRYALVLWDHGAAFLGFGGDETASKGSIMRLPALAGALKDSGIEFDMLGFDACLMANSELALELRPFAKVLAVSEELEPGDGWDYTAVLDALTRNPTMSGLDLGKIVADSYLAFYKKNSPAEALYLTFTLLDLQEMPKVMAAITAFGTELNRYIMTDTQGRPAEQLVRIGQVIGQARYETPGFFRKDFTNPGLVFDLGLLADNAAKFTKDERIAQRTADLKAALAKAVIYTIAGDGFKGTPLSGLSLHLPVYIPDFRVAEPYGNLPEIKKTKWSEYITAFTQAANQDKKPPVVAQPKPDVTVVVAGRNKATITGAVADETLVTGVVVGVTGIIGQQAVLFGFEEQPRTYRSTNDYSYPFDGMGWYLDDGKEPQLVFAAQWRPGQRAVFGLYQESPDYEPVDAYFVYDETSGRLIQGFDTSGNWIGALLPGVDSAFLPFLYTPDLKIFNTRLVLVRNTTLKKGPLPEGEYLITVTGFDLGNNSATGATAVLVRSREEARACVPSEVDAASSVGQHRTRFALGSLSTQLLGLQLDRNRVARVRYVVDVVSGGDGKLELKVVGTDGQTVGASGTIHTHSADAFQPQFSGPYLLVLEDKTGGPKNVLVDWLISPKEGLQLPPLIDLDQRPEQVDLLEQPGLHIVKLTIPGAKSLNLNLDLDKTKTPWIGYSIEVPQGSQAMRFTVINANKEPEDDVLACGLHMGGFQVPKSGEHQFIFDNRQGREDRVVTLWIEGYSVGTAPAATTTQTLSDWCTGDHSQDFTVAAGQVLRLLVPCDGAKAATAAFNLTRALKYQILAPNGTILASGPDEFLVQGAFPISSTGQYVVALDNTANTINKSVKVTLSVQARTTPAPAAVQPPAPTPTPAPISQPLADWCLGEHSQDFTVPAGRVVRLVIPCDSSRAAQVTFGLLGVSGEGRIQYQALAPDGAVLASGTHGYLAQETFSIFSSGEYIIVLDNRSSPSSRTVKLTVTVKGR